MPTKPQDAPLDHRQPLKQELMSAIQQYRDLAHDAPVDTQQRMLDRITAMVDQLGAPDHLEDHLHMVPEPHPEGGITLHLPTDAQAAAVIAALDLYTRLALGQIEEISMLVRLDEIKPSGKMVRTEGWLDSIEATTHQLKALLGHPRNGSFGLGHPLVGLKARRCYEVEKVLSKALAIKRDPNPNFRGVSYDGLTVRYTQDPEPSASDTPTHQGEPNA